MALVAIEGPSNRSFFTTSSKTIISSIILGSTPGITTVLIISSAVYLVSI